MSLYIFNIHGNKIDFEIHCSWFYSRYDPTRSYCSSRSFHVMNIKYSIDIYMSIDYGIILVIFVTLWWWNTRHQRMENYITNSRISKSPTYKSSSCELLKMETCIPWTSGMSEMAAGPPPHISRDPTALISPASSPSSNQ